MSLDKVTLNRAQLCQLALDIDNALDDGNLRNGRRQLRELSVRLHELAHGADAPPAPRPACDKGRGF
jgi:hypothetical protein